MVNIGSKVSDRDPTPPPEIHMPVRERAAKFTEYQLVLLIDGVDTWLKAYRNKVAVSDMVARKYPDMEKLKKYLETALALLR